jgi:hypothetical protein
MRALFSGLAIDDVDMRQVVMKMLPQALYLLPPRGSKRGIGMTMPYLFSIGSRLAMAHQHQLALFFPRRHYLLFVKKAEND